MNTLEILQKLIAIPSFVSGETNERKLGEYIYELFISDSNFEVTKQKVEDDRFNLIVRDKYPTRLLLAGHIDTVESKKVDQLKSEIKGDRLYGLGAVDMLAGVASIINLLKKFSGQSQGIAALFYIDEEYYFKGMNKFISEMNFKPDLCVIPEPTNLQICNAHRGLIEVEYIVRGKSAHAARPQEGLNAIEVATESVRALSRKLTQFKSSELGFTTCNLSQIQGGLDIGSRNGNLKLSGGTNSVPDICKVRLDIRPASLDLNEQIVRKLFIEETKRFGGQFEYASIINDLGCLISPKNSLVILEDSLNEVIGEVKYIDPNNMGYGDGQMIFQSTNTPVVYFGPGPTSKCHTEDEYVNISDITIVDRVFEELLNKYKLLNK